MQHFMKKDLQVHYQEFYKKVELFNRIAGNDYNHKELITTYIDLLLEETEEFLDANEDKDKIEFVDGWLDIGVIGSFLYLLLNDSHFDSGTRYSEEVQDMVPAVETIKQAYNELLNVSGVDSSTLHLVSRIMHAFEDIGEVINCNVVMCLDRVCENNMNKFRKYQLEIFELYRTSIEAVAVIDAAAIEREGRYEEVTYKVNVIDSNVYIVFLANKDVKNNTIFSKPKIVKPVDFKELDIKDLIY